MKLYKAYNGYLGNGTVYCLVIADNDDSAIDIAREQYRKDADINKRDEHYYRNIEVELIFEDCSIPQSCPSED